jgi:hypothetical protein
MAAKRDRKNRPTEPADSEFVRLTEGEQPGLLREFWDFLRYNKKWWLLPILVTLLVLGTIVLLTGTAFAPFIYTLF